jgi:hypothetical protein
MQRRRTRSVSKGLRAAPSPTPASRTSRGREPRHTQAARRRASRTAPLAIGLALATCLGASPARAAGFPDESYRALPCRPTIACTADLVPPGALEIELGYLRKKLPDGVAHSVPLLLKLTLLRDLQLQAGTGTALLSMHGVTKPVDDFSAGLKLRFLHQGGIAPSLSVSLAAGGVDVWSEGKTAYGALATVYATKDIGWLHADLNGGVNVWRLGGEYATQPFGALALSTDLGHGFSPMIEGYAYGNAGFIGPKDAGILAALAYAPIPYLVFDVGGDVALFRDTRSFSLFAGVTMILADLWDEGGATK